MKSSTTLIAVIFVLLACPLAEGQEIPKGVNYKRAPETVNALAKSIWKRHWLVLTPSPQSCLAKS